MSEYVFDAAAILGIGTPSTQPLPAPEAGFITLVVPNGLSLQTLRDSAVGKKLLHQQSWYDQSDWSREALPAGVYRLRLPVPDSNRKTFAEQQAMLPQGETVAPVTLVAAALLCIKLQGGPDPLDDGWVRCAEPSVQGRRFSLAWCGDRLAASGYWGVYRSDCVVSASIRTAS